MVEETTSLRNNDVEPFAEYLLESYCEGRKRWPARTASADVHAPIGVGLSSDRHAHLLSCPSVATGEASSDEADAAAEGDPCSEPHPLP